MHLFSKPSSKRFLTALVLGTLSLTAFSNSPLPTPVAPPHDTVVSPERPTYVLTNAELEKSLPKQAQEWMAFIKATNPDLKCPQYSNTAECTFASAVQLDATSNGEYQITIKGNTFMKTLWALPSLAKNSNVESSSKIWFKKVLLQGKDAEVVHKDNTTFVQLNEGEFDLKLILSKDGAESLSALSFQNMPLMFINNIKSKAFIRDGNTIRWAQPEAVPPTLDTKTPTAQAATQEELQLNVYRKITTGIPNILSTTIKMIYSGKPKDFYLGKVLPEEFEFNRAHSTLRIEKKEDGFWVKLMAGENDVHIEAFLLKNNETFKTQGLVSTVDHEIWSLEQSNTIRQVEVKNAESLDPKQALVPDRWKTLPAFLIKEAFVLKTNQRGIETNTQLDIKVRRTSYYGFDQDRMVHFDAMAVNNAGAAFLTKSDASVTLENVKVNEQNQVVVNNHNTLGISIPTGNFNAKSQSYTNATTMNTQFFEGTTTLNQWDVYVAPRMRMVAALGQSIQSNNTWLDYWTLYSVFSVFVIVLAFYKLMGRTTAALAFIGLLTFQQEIFSWALWLSMLGILGLMKVLPSGPDHKFHGTVKNAGLVALGLFTLCALNFIKTEIQLMVNPSLEILFPSEAGMAMMSVAIKIMAVLLIGTTVFKIIRSFKRRKTHPKKSGSILVGIAAIFVGFILFSMSGLLQMGTSTMGISSSSSEGAIPGMPGDMMEDRSMAVMPSAAPMMKQEMLSGSMSRSNTAPREDKAKKFSSSDITQNIMQQKAQLGRGVLSWPFRPQAYTLHTTGAISQASDVQLWIAPVWLVNVFALFQIAFLLLVLFIFGIGMLHLSNHPTWWERIPERLRNHPWLTFLITHDLKKGV